MEAVASLFTTTSRSGTGTAPSRFSTAVHEKSSLQALEVWSSDPFYLPHHLKYGGKTHYGAMQSLLVHIKHPQHCWAPKQMLPLQQVAPGDKGQLKQFESCISTPTGFSSSAKRAMEVEVSDTVPTASRQLAKQQQKKRQQYGTTVPVCQFSRDTQWQLAQPKSLRCGSRHGSTGQVPIIGGDKATATVAQSAHPPTGSGLRGPRPPANCTAQAGHPECQTPSGSNQRIGSAQTKRTKKLDQIATTQMEVAQLEAKLTEDNALLINLKQRHLAELNVNLPATQADPSAPTAAAFATLTAQLQTMVGILGQIAGTPGIDPSVAASIAQIIPCPPATQAAPQPAQMQQAQMQQAQMQQTHISLVASPAGAAAHATPMPGATAIPMAGAAAIPQHQPVVPSLPASWGNAEGTSGTRQEAPPQLVPNNTSMVSSPASQLPLVSPSYASPLVGLSPSQQAAAAARATAIEQIVAGSQSARERSRSRHSAPSDSDDESCAILTIKPAARGTAQPNGQVFQPGGQDA